MAGYDAVQGVSASRPTYGVSSFNGAPGISFDGVDDELTCTTAGLLAALPIVAAPSELWGIIDQASLPGDASARYFLAYGSTTNAARRLGRGVGGGQNAVQGQTGTGGGVVNSVSSASFFGRHVARVQFGATQTVASLDGVAGTAAAAVPVTDATRVRIGSTSNFAAGGFILGVIRDVLITGPLSVVQATALNAWAVGRR